MLLDPVDLFNGYTIKNSIRFIANAIVTVVDNDPHRVSLSIYYLSGTVLRVSPFPDVTTVSGFSIPSTLPPFKLSLQLDGGAVAQKLFGISDMGGASVWICEVLFDPNKARL